MTGRGGTRLARVDAARGGAPGAPPIAYTYTPVYVTVTAALLGDLRAGERVTIRALGGEAEGKRYEFDGVPEPTVYAPGTNLMLFTAPVVDTGEGEPAATPNFVYVLESSGRARSAAHPDQVIDAEEFRRLVREAEGR